MNSQNSLSVTEARSKIFDLVKKTAAGARFFLTDRGRAKAVLMSADEFDSWQETMEVMREFPNLDKDVAEADRAVKTGEYKKWATLDDIKKNYGMVVADKPKKHYGIHPSRKAKSSKKHR